jgi:hypothetical protein
MRAKKILQSPSLWLFFTLLLAYAYFFPRWASWSQNSRLNLIISIVEDGSLTIDRFCRDQGGLTDAQGKPLSECENTGDYAKLNGHFYSDKAPGLAFLGVPPYAAFKAIAALPPVARGIERLAQSKAFASTLQEGGSGLQTEKITYALALYFVTVITISIPAALLGVLLYLTLQRLGLPPQVSFGAALIYGLATPAFAYGGMLFSHQLIAFLVFAAFYLAFIPARGNVSTGRLMAIGLLSGWAVITEYPSVLIAAAVGVYALWKQPRPAALLWLALGALIPAGLLLAYDYAAFGTLLPVGYQYSALYTQEGGAHTSGFLSLTYPHVEALWGITFGSFRGLFFLSPVLLLAVAGFVRWWKAASARAEWALALWAVISFFLFNGSSVMWQGGFAVGPRYLLPMLPFFALGLGFALEAVIRPRWGRAALGILTLWSLLAVWIETIGGQSFPDWTPNPLFHYSLPNVLAGDIARNLAMAVGLRGVWGVLVLWIALAGLIVIGWRMLSQEWCYD